MEFLTSFLTSRSSSLSIFILLGAFIFSFFCIRRSWLLQTSNRRLPSVPSVAGSLPFLGNLLQLKESKPFQTFTQWARIYGPIYSIRIGPSTVIVLNSTELVKEALVARFDSVAKDMSLALNLISYSKGVISMSDYNDFYRLAKRHLVSYVSGSKAMKRSQDSRESMVEEIINRLTDCVKINPTKDVNIREIFDTEFFRVVVKEAVGCDVESLYVEELGKTMSIYDIYKILVLDIIKGATEIDIRDLFPYLSRIPISSMAEKRVKGIVFRRMAVMKALIQEHKRLCNIGQGMDCYYDYLKSQPDAAKLSETQILVWTSETISGRTDTTSITLEWALYELAKDPERQEILHQEIVKVCGTRTMNEEDLSQVPYLNAIVLETLRTHHPAAILPPRLVKEDTQIGGYHVPAGCKIMINLYGCNKDKNEWEDADEWIPERFVGNNRFDQQDWFKTLSFGAGKRVCPGATLGMLVSCLTIGRLVQKFEFRLKDQDKGDADTVGLTTHKLHPLQLLLKPRY